MIESPARESAESRTTEEVEIDRPLDGVTTRVCERFLELPAALVLAVMWLTGAALLALCGLTLYLAGTVLAPVFAGV